VGKTGGGPGTNQYKVRGQSKRQPRAVHGYPAGQVIKQGECVWLQAGFDDIWCLTHRQLAPELRELVGLTPCIIKLDPKLQEQIVEFLPSSAFGPWAGQAPAVDVRLAAARRAPEDQLQWATQDPDPWVRHVAAKRMPPDQLGWAVKDKDDDVRVAAAERMPEDQLSWATKDKYWKVRKAAARRMPSDQLSWAAKDGDKYVREAAAKRMPLDQLAWAITDPDYDVREAAWWRGARPAPKSLRPAAPQMRWIGPR